MNHLKEVCRLDGVCNFLTYADNFAVGYFKKQGFTKEITQGQDKWKGYIKDYEGGTLMECCILPNIEYLQIPKMIHKQREAVYDKIKQISNSHIIRPGLNFKNGQTHIPIEQIAGISMNLFFLAPFSSSSLFFIPLCFLFSFSFFGN